MQTISAGHLLFHSLRVTLFMRINNYL
ncbi:hypothetical protein TSAR_014776 [Trichomalopsis sarcophagae]|uniref:Uncharacterized protein n=1 Tax=Trichomalopsis sarcophagae TaxID=543379 RepID=A0A232FKQ6_9HYME|nr:hypothetical protein TSAR_014776 [Trichomalopsis sarcophagae]